MHINPNVDFFAARTYSTQDNYKDGTGYEVANTWNRLSAGIAKLTVRPATATRSSSAASSREHLTISASRGAGRRSQYGDGCHDHHERHIRLCDQRQELYASLGWTYSRPDDKLFDWDAKIYWNRTENDQTKILHTSPTSAFGQCTTANPGNPISGCVGDPRSYDLNTFGFDVHNTSRAETGDWRHAFTYGLDGFQDKVKTFDETGNSFATTRLAGHRVGASSYKANYAACWRSSARSYGNTN